MEMKSRAWLRRAGWAVTAGGCGVSLCGDEHFPKSDSDGCTPLNVLEVVELCTSDE